MNGDNQTIIIQSNLISPAGLALDWITDKIYYTDMGTNRIEVATIDGRLRTMLVWQGIEKPRDIVVNPIEGLIKLNSFECCAIANLYYLFIVKV